MISISCMREEDVEAVSKLETECFSMPWSADAILKSFQMRYATFLVAYDDNKVVGYAGFYMVSDEMDITNIAVTYEYRRLGIASRLMDEVFERAKSLKATSIFLEVRESNKSAISFYEKKGFVMIGERKNFYQKPTENGLLYKYTL